MRGRHKLVGQVVAACILLGSDVVIRKIGVFGYTIDLGALAVPLTVLWLTGAMNAMNLLDGMDGMAATLGIVISLAISALALMTHHAAVAVAALVFSGSLLGFLCFNLSPASIFLGDSGSMLIGLVIGGLSIRASLKGSGTVLLAAPIALLLLPMFDTTIAIVRRKLTGRSIYTTDRGHLHHCLLARFGTSRKVLVCVGICCAATCAAALTSVSCNSDWIALVVCAAILAMLVLSRLFGHAEARLLANRLRSAAAGWLSLPARNRHKSRETVTRLRGSRQWELLWNSLTESAERLPLRRIHFDVNLPAIREEFSATWELPSEDEADACDFTVPLVANDVLMGRLRITANRTGRSVCDTVVEILEILEPFETRLQAFAQMEACAAASSPPIAGHRRARKPRDAALLKKEPI